MKTLLAIAMILMNSFAYSGTDSLQMSDSGSISYELKNIILTDKTTADLQLSGTAGIIFSVDQDNKLVIKNIYSENYAAVYHLRHLLEDRVINTGNICTGHLYEVKIDFSAQYISQVF